MLTKYNTAIELQNAINSSKNPESVVSKASAEAREALIKESGYTIEESTSGYYRLIDHDGNAIIDDAACEDYYNRENAAYMFLLYLVDNGLLVPKKVTKKMLAGILKVVKPWTTSIEECDGRELNGVAITLSYSKDECVRQASAAYYDYCEIRVQDVRYDGFRSRFEYDVYFVNHKGQIDRF